MTGFSRKQRGRRRVVVTGAAGLIGRHLVEEMGQRWDIVGLDGRRVAGVRRLDLRRQQRVRSAFAGADAVVDLAGDPRVDAPWSVVMDNNVALALSTLEAAEHCGVRRVVYASSNHVTGAYERDEPYASVLAGRYAGLDPRQLTRITPTDPVRPDSPYGVGKVMAETAARWYADECDLSVICLRLGNVNRQDRPLLPRHFSVHLSVRDLLQLVIASVEAPAEVRFGTYYGVSANTWRIWELDTPGRDLGYHPIDDAERWRELIGSRSDSSGR